MYTRPIGEDPARGPIGRPPAVPVMFPNNLPVADLAALAARAGYRVKWIRRAGSGAARLGEAR